MGWVPSSKRGVSEEPEPAPRKRRPRGTGTRARQTQYRKDAALMEGRDERIVDSRPASGKRDETHSPVTVELGKRWSRIVKEIRSGAYTWQQFAEGLTAEELARGQLRDENGGFKGRPPTMVPREFHLACFRELKRRFDEEFQSGVLDIAKEYVKLAQDPALPVKDRAKMMQYAMERVFGGIPREVLVKQDAPWEGVFAAVIVNEEGEAADHEVRRYEQFDPDAEDDSD